MQEKLKEELNFCLKLWEEQGHCNFGGTTKCEHCASPYLLYKLISNKVLHDEKMTRLSLEEWKNLIKPL